jgi:regulatory protein
MLTIINFAKLHRLILQDMVNKKYSVNEAIKKAEHYCVYQDRCHQEMRSKLLEWGIYGLELENILTHLINHDFLNEERFARSYARGKFRIKHWGKIKIKQHLKSKQVSEYCIKKGLTEIDEEDYQKTIEQLIQKKMLELNIRKLKPSYKNQIIKYLMGKGFEYDMIEIKLNEAT